MNSHFCANYGSFYDHTHTCAYKALKMTTSMEEPKQMTDKEKKLAELKEMTREIKKFKEKLNLEWIRDITVYEDTIDGELDDLMLCLQTEIGKLVCEE
jgi:hypothetical protein